MKKYALMMRIPVVLMMGLLLLLFCPAFPVAAASSQTEISPVGTLWMTNLSHMMQFRDTPAQTRGGERGREALAHYGTISGDPYVWRMEGSTIYMRDKNSLRDWDDIVVRIVDETAIRVSVYNMREGDTAPKITNEYDMTRVFDPVLLKKHGAAPVSQEKIWNLKRDDFSLKKTLWKYQSDDGNNYPHYLSFADNANTLYCFRSYNRIFQDTWRQDGKSVFFSIKGDYDENAYEGKFLDWGTIKGTYRNRKSPDGKPIGFKLFRITDHAILERYIDPHNRPKNQDSDMHAVRIENPNNYSVLVTVRNVTGPDNSWNGMETIWNVPPKNSREQRFPNGKYEIYFKYSDKPKDKYQGDGFSIAGGGVEIKLVAVTGGNYGIRKVN